MQIHRTSLEGLYIIEPELRIDDRGSFMRIFCKNELGQAGLSFDMVQASRSFNKLKGIIRGLHFQKLPKAEDKIVQCIKGAIYDVAVDLRPDSPTYGKWIALELSEENKKLLYVPKGFAHGFQTLTDGCEVQYFMSAFYSPEHYAGVLWNDPLLGINWPIKNPILSHQDSNWPSLRDI